MKKWKLVFTVVVMAATFLLAACGGGSSAEDLVGRWTLSTNRQISFDFRADGSVVHTNVLFGQTQISTVNGTWSVDNGVLTIDLGDHMHSGEYRFSVNGDSLDIRGFQVLERAR